MLFRRSHLLKSPRMRTAASGYAFSCLLIILCSSLSALSSLAKGGTYTYTREHHLGYTLLLTDGIVVGKNIIPPFCWGPPGVPSRSPVVPRPNFEKYCFMDLDLIYYIKEYLVVDLWMNEKPKHLIYPANR